MLIYNDSIFEGVFNTALDAIIIINEKGIVQAFNPAAIELFGYQPKEIIGLNITTLMPKKYAAHHDEYIENYLTTGKRKIIGIGREVEGQRKDGSIFPIHLSVSEATIKHQKIFIGIARDITEQRNTESFLKNQRNNLQTLNQELESFSYSVSHDLSAPLRHITGYTELLSQHISNSENTKVKKDIDVIRSEAERMEQLIQSLLSFSRLGRASLNKTMTSFNQIIHQLITTYAPETQSRNINWQVPSLPEVFCDKEMLSLVWENLISNAIKFAANKDKTVIKISYQKQESHYQFAIEDNGVGFDPKNTDKLFKVFQRLHDASEFNGTGIGLVNIKKIIEKHGGKVWIEGKLNHGATVYFTLPINESK